jgi:hypothetical protein
MTATQNRTVAIAAVAVLITFAFVLGSARAQVVSPRPEDLRFQALRNEPIAALDRKSVVAGTSALLVQDRQTGQCYVVISVGASIAMTAAACGK